MRLSVIIPVYNAEKTLSQSLQSIATMKSHDIEIIFVDDCSTDGSVKILEEFSSKSEMSCKILHQPSNGGVAAARNRGLDAAEGDYIMWLDADDTFSSEALDVAVEAAKDGSDIIGWDWTLGFIHNGRYMRQADYDTPVQALKNLMGGTMRWNLWLFMVKRELIENNNIRFIPGANMGEDMMFMLKAFSFASIVKQIHQSLYCYNAVSTSSISRQFSEERRKEVSENLGQALECVGKSEYADELALYFNQLKLYVKLPLLMSTVKSNYLIWYNWMPEANGDYFANKSLPVRTRMVQWMAANRLWVGVKTYYVFVYKLVYGLIYR